MPDAACELACLVLQQAQWTKTDQKLCVMASLPLTLQHFRLALQALLAATGMVSAHAEAHVEHVYTRRCECALAAGGLHSYPMRGGAALCACAKRRCQPFAAR